MVRLSDTLIALCILILFSISAHASDETSPSINKVAIHLAKIGTEDLEVSYTLDSPVDSLQLRTTPDRSRAGFWRAKSKHFQLIHVKGNDVIRRADSKPFSAVTFVVDIVDISLPQYYRPFSPLFDTTSGVVLHTGQYFACPNDCKTEPASWQIQVTASDKNIVHFQAHELSKAAWQDSGDGRSFYLGTKLPIETDYLVAVIDPGLPDKLKTMLDTQLPILIDRLGKEFAPLETKPLVFATYNSGDPERRGHQGGVLNKTIFMHWWGPNLQERIDERDELWFFAHEIAHLYQHQNSKVDVDEVAWIHEGFAELMAAELLAQTNEALNDYVQDRFDNAKTRCDAGLEVTPIGKATALKQFDLHYKCGLLLHRFITQNANEALTVFELWNRYRAAIDNGMSPSKQTYLNVVEKLLQKEDFSLLQTIVGSALVPNEAKERFIAKSNF